MEWLWQWLITKGLEYIVPFLAAVLMAWWKQRDGRWANAILFGVVVFVCIWVLSGGLQRVYDRWDDPNFVESRIRQWADEFNLTVRKSEPAPNLYFKFRMAHDPNRAVYVAYPKRLGNYIAVTGGLEVSRGHQDLIAKLPLGDQRRLARHLRIEITRFGVGHHGIGIPLKEIYFEKLVPIDSSLTRHRFIEVFGLVDGAQVLARELIALHAEKQGASLDVYP